MKTIITVSKVLGPVIFTIALILSICSCDSTTSKSNNAGDGEELPGVCSSVSSPESEEEEKENAYELMLSIEHYRSLPDSIRAKRRVVVIMSEFVSIRDSIYVIDIDKKQAESVGITAEEYDEFVQNIKDSNEVLAALRRTDGAAEMVDIKAIRKLHKQGKWHEGMTGEELNKLIEESALK